MSRVITIRCAFLIIAIGLFGLDALADGRDAYDRAVAWRKFVDSESRPAIGLALGGGGARGMAHVGVLRSLGAAGIPVDRVAGTSIGSFVGALYSTGASIDEIENLALQTNWSNLIELKMSRIGFFSTRRLERFINFHLSFLQRDILRLPSQRAADAYLSTELTDLNFSDLKIPFACSAADLYSGSIIVFDSGPVAQAVRASCSIPGLFEPITIDEQVLVDGGVLLNLPVSLCKNLGASYVIAVDLESDTSDPVTGLVDVLAQIIKIQGIAITTRERDLADELIMPAVGKIKTTDLKQTAVAIRAGEIAGALRAAAIKNSILSRFLNYPVSADTVSFANDLRQIEIPPLTTSYDKSAENFIPAAAAAARVGLDREALRILERIPARKRNAESAYIEALAKIRLRKQHDAEEALERFLKYGDTDNHDRCWRLAAAAIDVRIDSLADSIVRHIGMN